MKPGTPTSFAPGVLVRGMMMSATSATIAFDAIGGGKQGSQILTAMEIAASRKAARQLIRHRHVEVNAKSVDIPSFVVHPGQEIRLRQKSRELVMVASALEVAARGATPSWLAVDKDTFSGRMLERPQRASIPIAAQEQLVVELYSK